MNASSLTIAEVAARAVVAPLKRPVRTAVGTIPAAPLVLIDLRTREGVVGRSYLFGYTPLALAPLVRLVESIGEELKGQPVVPVERQAALDRRFRLLGWQGLVGMAVAGLDMALWDALGHAAGWPVARLLGGEASRCRPTTATAWSTRQPTRPTSAARSSGASGRSRSNGDGSSSDDAGSSGTSGTSTTAGDSGSSGAPGSVQGVALTDQGTALTLGEAATVSWQPNQHLVGVMKVSVKRLEKVPILDVQRLAPRRGHADVDALLRPRHRHEPGDDRPVRCPGPPLPARREQHAPAGLHLPGAVPRLSEHAARAEVHPREEGVDLPGLLRAGTRHAHGDQLPPDPGLRRDHLDRAPLEAETPRSSPFGGPAPTRRTIEACPRSPSGRCPCPPRSCSRRWRASPTRPTAGCAPSRAPGSTSAR